MGFVSIFNIHNLKNILVDKISPKMPHIMEKLEDRNYNGELGILYLDRGIKYTCKFLSKIWKYRNGSLRVIIAVGGRDSFYYGALLELR